MKKENGSEPPEILRVLRSKEEAKQFYDRVSLVYDYFIGIFERKYAETALRFLAVKEG